MGWISFRRRELAREGLWRWLPVEERPLPNPLPEGRGDRWADADVLELAG